MLQNTESQKAVYSTSDVALLLNIQQSTLRKYSLIIEEQGHEFLKNKNGYRAFFDSDIIFLRKFLELKNEADMSLSDAAKSVVSWFDNVDVSTDDTEEERYVLRYNDLVNEFKDFKEQQLDYNKQLLQELQKQQEYMDKRLEQRDHVLLQTLNDMTETKKQIAATEQEKENKWWQFWK